MSKAGYPYVNSLMERYFNILKRDLIYRYYYRIEEELYTAVKESAYFRLLTIITKRLIRHSGGINVPHWEKDRLRWSSIFVTFTLKKIIDWNISFQTVSCIHLMNVDVYDCNSHIHNLISRREMAHWTILCTERYLSLIYDCMHKKLYEYHVLQADETPVRDTKENRTEGSKQFMWVYRTGKMYEDRPIILYVYQPSRNLSHRKETTRCGI